MKMGITINHGNINYNKSTHDENLELPFEPDENFLAAIFSDSGQNWALPLKEFLQCKIPK